MIAMLRDSWWWPWWVSSLIDLAVVFAALIFFRRSTSRTIRALATAIVVVGLAAAGLAPIVMTEPSDPRMRNEPAMPGQPP